MKYFSLEGNIGSGKTTVLNLIESSIDQQLLKVVFQPVNEWRQVGLNKSNILDQFYKDAEKWSFPFQILTLFTRVNSIIKAQGAHKNILGERSPDGDFNIFAKEMEKVGLFGRHQMDVYEHMFNGYKKMYPAIKSQGIIYLNTPPQICYNRICRRKRPQEDPISMDYLSDLHNLHLNWMQKSQVPVLVLDGSKNFISEVEERDQIVRQIAGFIGVNAI